MPMSEFPKFYSHSNEKLANRVAHTPTDEVNLVARGYKQVDTKAADKAADDSAQTDQSNTGGGDQSADARNAVAKKAASSNRNS
jgi:hypothetical protein